MSNGFLSQEEIDSLLNGTSENVENDGGANENGVEIITDIEKDLLGEVGNISMGSASTALSQIIGLTVNITTPVVTVTTLGELRKGFVIPNIALDVKYVSGITGRNLLVMKVTDAAVIANLMMGGDGKIEKNKIELTEIEVSAVSEAMNQMIGSAATSMATMFSREVNISPPSSKIWDKKTVEVSDAIEEDDSIIHISFKLTIGDIVDSSIMQILPIETGKKIVNIMMGNDKADTEDNLQADTQPSNQLVDNIKSNNQVHNEPQMQQGAFEAQNNNYNNEREALREKPVEMRPQVDVKQASFQPLLQTEVVNAPKNIDLILDVPLQISVVLGRSKMNIKDILDLGTGSLIELDKLAEEPVEILVNGKKIAYGEVVVVDENFGVRITSIVSNEQRVKSLGK